MVFIWVAAERRGGAGDFFFMALITAGFELGDKPSATALATAW